MSIPFQIPAEFITRIATGEAVRYGAIIKDAASGHVLGHLQETNALRSAVNMGSALTSLNPAGVTAVVQNMVITSKLNALQSAMGTMQTLQMATLASSVIGIGVTAASTAIILKRLSAVDASVRRLEKSVDAIPALLRETDLRKTLVKLEASLDRIQEAEVRRDRNAVLQAEEARLQDAFTESCDAISFTVSQDRINPELLQAMLEALSLCGAAEFKVRIWRNEVKGAEKRASNQCTKLQNLAFIMPRQKLASRMTDEAALLISKESSEMRLRIASQPELARTLLAHGINGTEYIERIQSEENEPLLLLPPRPSAT
ncbi:hypothetical protein ACEUZ9_002834 [Paracoccus litorisediminis]|uniref:hypothetical protein n=1 Tax=Paracoccus litorisediminis TaxID=2006130 RepID=UPI003731A915